MRTALVVGLSLGLSLAACKDPETAAAEARKRAAAQKMSEGRGLLASGKPEQAAAAFQAAAAKLPQDVEPLAAMADAYERAGNEGAAILALKQAVALRSADAGLKKRLAALYRQGGHLPQAAGVLSELKDANQLEDPELLTLAKVQAHIGDLEGALRTLERVQIRQPDDPEAKVVEAEILLRSGEELLAAKLMDRLVGERPDLTAVRLLRARYFFHSGYAELAERELSDIRGAAAQLPEVVSLKARLLNTLRRHDEAEAALRLLLEAKPSDPELLAQLAETQLHLGRFEEAQSLVAKALTVRPRFARALYVGGRAREAQGELDRAAEGYQAALKSDPAFAPALSRLWPIYQHRGERGEAMSALERLFFLGEASLQEKVALAELYAQGQINGQRGRKLIEEALRRDPENARYREIKAALAKIPSGAPQGPVIIRGGR